MKTTLKNTQTGEIYKATFVKTEPLTEIYQLDEGPQKGVKIRMNPKNRRQLGATVKPDIYPYIFADGAPTHPKTPTPVTTNKLLVITFKINSVLTAQLYKCADFSYIPELRELPEVGEYLAAASKAPDGTVTIDEVSEALFNAIPARCIWDKEKEGLQKPK